MLWIFTNNKNSPNNDAQTRERNRDFYNLLHKEPSISKTLAFPLHMPVKGQLFEAQGLMVYALAYGEPAAKALDAIMAQGRLSKVLTKPPARLKPVDQLGNSALRQAQIRRCGKGGPGAAGTAGRAEAADRPRRPDEPRLPDPGGRP